MAEDSDAELTETNENDIKRSLSPAMNVNTENQNENGASASPSATIGTELLKGELPNRPGSTASSVTGRVLDIHPENVLQIESPIVSGPVAEEDEDDDDGSAGYEESAERDEIIRERINRTQEQMR